MQSIQSLQPLRQIMASAYARYASITAKGIILSDPAVVYNPLVVTIVGYSPARTYYRNRKPFCRSLNGVRAIDRNTTCACCADRRCCTPQINLEIIYRIVPFRLLLSYTCANNFMILIRTLNTPNKTIEGALVQISVVNRGKWGETQFIEKK